MTVRRALFVVVDTILWAWFGLAALALLAYGLGVVL